MNSHITFLFKENTVIKFVDKVYPENILFIFKYLSNLLPPVVNGWFTLVSDKHNYNTSCTEKDQLCKLSHNTVTYVKYFLKALVIVSWNGMQNQLKKSSSRHLSGRNITLLLTKNYLSGY